MTFLNKYNIKRIAEPRYTCSYGKWYISGSCEVEIKSLEKTEKQLGLDWGIENFMTSSNGTKINYPRTVLRQFYRINSLKSKLSKKNKDSNNHQKLKEKVNKAYFRLENLKKDFIEQTTTELARKNNIAAEDLTNAKILMSNKNRRRLRIIAPLDRFITALEWKCKKFGRIFIKVNPAYTSMDCSQCGKRNLELTVKDRIYRCSCGLELDRDVNAACNIVARGFC
jgi:putative transposase